jgi:hypothetical protein
LGAYIRGDSRFLQKNAVSFQVRKGLVWDYNLSP